ncbi:MAG: hypothetical protein LIO53_04810, partial [Oscillospiraceae bacterium]|nr:hypothetical protein [Oscillospiraceae bacterium]
MKRRFLSLLLAFTMLAALAPLALAAEDEWLVETKTYEDLDGTEETTYTYDFDSNGHIITYYSESSSGHWDQHTYTYDSTGNKLSEYYESSSVYWYQRTYTYDS